MNHASSYTNIFALCFSAAEVLDSEPAMQQVTTKRMIKKAEKEANPPPPKVPEVLQPCSKAGKRFRGTDGSTKTAFMPAWGICEQDSISGSSLLAVDWSKCSITAHDLADALSRTSLEEGEQLGSQAMYQVHTLTYQECYFFIVCSIDRGVLSYLMFSCSHT